MRPAVSKCLNCQRPVRNSDRRYLDAPARNGEPAMGIPDGGCRYCQVDSEDHDRDRHVDHQYDEMREHGYGNW